MPNPDYSPGNFTPRAQQVLVLARKEAERFNHLFVGTEHLLLGLIRLGQGTAVNVLRKQGIDLETVRLEVEKQIGMGPDQKVFGNIPYTPRVKKVLALAAKETNALGHTYVGTEHILLGLLKEGDGVAALVLKNLGADIDRTRQEILRELDPNFTGPADGIERSAPTTAPLPPRADAPMNSTPPKPRPDLVDTSKRYDVYCAERGQAIVVYRNVLFKGARYLFPKAQQGLLSEFVELEQADGQTVFVARSSVVKFCEDGAIPNPESPPGGKP